MAQAVRTERVEAQLHSARAAIAPGETFTVVLRQSIATDWHTYWRNPGDSGEPTELTWTAPSGYGVGGIQWPAPKALPYATFVNFGYDGEVLFPIEITAPRNARVGSNADFTVAAHWLVCSPEICVPEDATLTFSVPVEAQGLDDREWAPQVAAAVAGLPRRDERATATISSGTPATLSVALPIAPSIRDVRFFPYDRDAIEASASQSPRVGATGVSFTLSPGVADNLGQGPLIGVVAYEVQDGDTWVRRGVEIEAAPGEPIEGTTERAAPFSPDYALADLDGAASAAPQAPAMSPIALIAALGLAFLGGLILNVMPCVLPVLSVKALQFAGGAHSGEARRHGVLYFAGVMATFLALAGLLIALRGAGEAVGWGFQLQAPWVTSALALLFFVIGLNLAGMFEIGGSLQNLGAGLTARRGDAGAFFTGALAVVAATPCTAPFMASAIGAALTQSALTSLLVFVALGLGFALPLTLLHFIPSLQRLIPKPGPGMERVRNVLAFPMLGAAVWLAWVLTEQSGSNATIALLTLFVAVTFLILSMRWGRLWLAFGVLQLVVTGAFVWRPLVGLEQQTVLASEPWSPARVTELQSEGRGVFVNFTAAWCVTCKVNEIGAFTPRVAQGFAEHNTAYLVGDWTNRDDAIAAALAEHGRAGVPLYLYYSPRGDVVVLPQILTEDLVLETIEGGR
jgi:thiol:disulfide interchange protein/DsbC/DsbD-like thiol-disulfide interchange protein